jgi:pimeloyl-ACP methyl ester carboxylesterase
MPYIDIVSTQSWTSIWYICNSPTGQTTGFDPVKPTILLLHPFLLDTTWLRAQLDNPDLSEKYNLIAPDLRCHGRSKSSLTGYHDLFVEAADLAFLHHVRGIRSISSLALIHTCHNFVNQRLHLPPVHVFAAESLATKCAMFFAAL